MTPTISVLTPSYGYAQFLPTALASVRSNVIHAEHVVMDGGSTDGSVEILQASDAVWRSEPDRGQSDALNKALAAATGDIVGWLNADDFYLPGVLDLVAQEFDRHPDTHVLYGDTALVDGDGRVQRLLKAYRPAVHTTLRWRGPSYLSTSTFFRRDLLGVDPFDPDMRMIMDWDLFLRLHAQPGVRFRHVPVPMAGFRFHEAQVTHGQTQYTGPEFSRLRQAHGIDERRVGITRPLGIGLHRAVKVATGSLALETSSRVLAGVPLLDAQGHVVPGTARALRRVADPVGWRR
ncbi:glycosyltransferase family 2 protein, partial [Kribbia dieselivorans]|uniref:glycosyltransferase family 2 protein n=1 Tax=Kribbia dieselivorans TaxID=331526 RepID=UPI00083805DF